MNDKKISISVEEIKNKGINLVEIAKMLSNTVDYGELLEKLLATNWVYEILVSCGTDSYASELNREYIVLELLYLLNKLKAIPEDQLKEYLTNSDTLLEEIIKCIQKEKGWEYDMRLAFRLCRCIVVDYLYEEESVVVVDQNSAHSALEQIVRNYEEDMLSHRINNIDFITYYDEQLNIYNDAEETKFYDKRQDVLRQLVSNRVLINEYV